MTRLPRIAAIHDLSGFGRCALTVILPTMSAMSLQVCPLPTAVLSAHMGYPSPAVVDLSDFMASATDHWAAEGLRFDAIYTGFLASSRQIALAGDFIARFAQDALVFVDPVMADHGKLYACFDDGFAAEMARLTRCANLITPNLTEAALLLGEAYDCRSTQADDYRIWVERLSDDGRRSVVLTGVQPSPQQIGATIFDHNNGQIVTASAPLIAQHYPGTGDLLASVLLGRLLQGCSLAESTQQAVDFVSRCAAYTEKAGTPPLEGVQFEALLHSLM